MSSVIGSSVRVPGAKCVGPRIFQSHAHAGHNFAAGERSLDVSCRVPTDLDIVWVC